MFAYLKLAALVVFYLFSMMFVIPNTLTVKNDEMMLWGIAYMMFIFVPVTYYGAKFLVRQVDKLFSAYQDNRDKGLKDIGEEVNELEKEAMADFENESIVEIKPMSVRNNPGIMEL